MTTRPDDAISRPDTAAGGAPQAAQPRRLHRTTATLGVLLVLAVAGGLVYVRSLPFGALPSGDRLARNEQSPQWRDGEFTDPHPLWASLLGAATESIVNASDTSNPNPPLSIAATDTALFDVAPEQGLRVTWFGHSSMLVELDGLRVLMDPFWGKQSGPSAPFGAKPFYPAPAELSEIGRIDAVLISHDHWDHLDQSTISAMADWPATTFVVPLGIGAHLQRWGVPAQRVRELDWWQSTSIGSVELVSTPARHNSGRDPFRSNETLWSGWAMRGPQHRAWYSGDTGYFPDLALIGQRLGPFDVTLIESGQYNTTWPDNHLGPELAVHANTLVRGKLMIPVHWALFNLAPHTWTEPVERVRAEAQCRNQRYLALTPGVPTEPTEQAVAAQQQWWPQLPWHTAEQAPINPTIGGDPDQRSDIIPCVREQRPVR